MLRTTPETYLFAVFETMSNAISRTISDWLYLEVLGSFVHIQSK